MPVCWHWSGSNPPTSNWREFAGTECLKSNSKHCLRSWFYTGISHQLAGCAAWRSGTPELHPNGAIDRCPVPAGAPNTQLSRRVLWAVLSWWHEST